MPTKTGIQWTDFSSNPIKYRADDGTTAGRAVWACAKVSDGCKNCYAEALAKRYGKGGPFNEAEIAKLTVSVDPVETGRLLRAQSLTGRRVFVGDMTDVFGSWVTDEMLDRLFATFALRPDVTFQVLTKRPERMRAYLASGNTWMRVNALLWGMAKPVIRGGAPLNLPNVWLGTSVEDQAAADKRIPFLLATPAAVRFISAEPLLGPIDLIGDIESPGPAMQYEGVRLTPNTVNGPAEYDLIGTPGLDWVIVGGESGPGARPCDVGWIRSIVDQCRAAEVPAFVKQLGGNVVSEPLAWGVGESGAVVGDHWRHKLKHTHGGDPAEWPESLRIREFPAA